MEPPSLVPECEPGGYVGGQTFLVVLDREEVVPTLADDLRADVLLAEHRVAGDDPALQRQHAEQLQGGLVLVGRGLDAQLGEHGPGGRGVGGQQVGARDLAVPAAAGGLAVDGQGEQLRRSLAIAIAFAIAFAIAIAIAFAIAFAFGGGQSGLCPAGERGLEGADVDGSEGDAEGGGRGRLAAAEPEGVGQGEALVAAELGDGGVALGAAEHGEHGQRQDGRQGVALAAGPARVGDPGEYVEQVKWGGHGEPPCSGSGSPHLLREPLLANVNNRIALVYPGEKG